MIEAGGGRRSVDVYIDLIPMPKRIGPGETLTWWREARQDCLELVSCAAAVESPEEKAAWCGLAKEIEGVDAAMQRAAAQGRPPRFKRNQDRYRRYATLSQLVDSARRLYEDSTPPRILAAMEEDVRKGQGEICGTPAIIRATGIGFGQ